MRYNNKMLLMKVTGALLIFGLVFIYSVSATASFTNLSAQEELDEYIQDTAKKLGIPGLSVAISHKGDMIYSRSFGKGMETDTRLYIGSVSKSFTALAVMQLVEQGKVDLDESVSTYIKEFTVSDKITVRHLLHQVSGMTENEYIANLPSEASFSDLVQDMNKMFLSYPPGEHYSYFNPNYSLLGFIVERVSGQNYTRYLEDHIFKPLGLENTSGKGEVDAPGHLSFFGISIERSEPFVQYALPAGFITSTAEDMVRYLEALRMRQPAVGVTPEGVEQMESGNAYGMGWMMGNISKRPAVHHGGALPGYSANAVMLVEDEYSIALLLNKNHMLNGLIFYPDLMNGIVSILTEQEPPSRVNYFWIFRLLIVLFAVTLISNIIKSVKLIFPSEEKTIRRRVVAVLVNLAIPAAMLFLIPLAVSSLLQRGMTWELAFLLMPDMLTWFFVGLAFSLLESVIHFSFIAKHHLNHN